MRSGDIGNAAGDRETRPPVQLWVSPGLAGIAIWPVIAHEGLLREQRLRSATWFPEPLLPWNLSPLPDLPSIFSGRSATPRT